jgi:hypothetical protein
MSGITGPPGTGGSGVTDHGALTGLADDDHPQYHNDARGDARYDALGSAAAAQAASQPLDSDLTALAAAGNSAVLAATTASFLTADETKLDSLIGTSNRTIGMTFDGGGSPPTVGSVGYVVAQFAGTIDRWNIVADQSGSAVIDVWKAAGAIPTDANRIAGTEKITLSAQQLASDTSLSTWSTLSVAVGDVLAFEIESVSTCTRLTAEVRVAEPV